MGDFFKKIWEFIVGLFQGIGNFFMSIFHPNAPKNAATTAPESSNPQNQDVAAPQVTQKKPPLVDNKSRAEIATAVKAVYFAEKNANPKTSDDLFLSQSAQNPTAVYTLFDQAVDGRLIVNMPKDATVLIRPATPQNGKAFYNIAVMPNSGDMPAMTRPEEQSPFLGAETTIPASIIENAQVVFLASSQQGRNHIEVKGGLVEGTRLVVQSQGAEIESRRIDLLVNGTPRYAGMLLPQEMKGLVAKDDREINMKMAVQRNDKYAQERDQLVAEQAAARATSKPKNTELADARRQQDAEQPHYESNFPYAHWRAQPTRLHRRHVFSNHSGDDHHPHLPHHLPRAHPRVHKDVGPGD